ncbi:hypothetical protein NAEGRDRAFT_58174 [Naegleria gruberi]|uniref:Cilia-and flagella-associated protein 96 n=1 Tax=Naegleria gruberi TaxID=5762 RepID=D2VGW4_NAEGR|nr:uncharacterized protein NAEGRDRAFT_58174 [Naegleria gruberi]EFC44133.1 hypothetical protein NAEGRDRAFT_58174 [Naegleria gruberi]|eukprot:XP_002676877.1 hypothetical protein NAEGRDRAFT_58174 [Naegleria gruberi strain NEG-M]
MSNKPNVNEPVDLGYTTIGDEYDKSKILRDQRMKDGRTLGKQFLTGPTKRGKVGKGITFGDFKSLYEGDPYMDPGTNERKYRKENEVKVQQTHKTPFKPSSPPKKSVGLGTYYGTIGSVFQHEQEYEVLAKGEKPQPIKEQKRPIYTSPPKRGTFGYLGLTISRGTEYKYETDPFDHSMEKKKEKENEKAKQVAKKAFISSSHHLDYFDTHKSVAAPRILGTDDKVEATIKKALEKESSSPKKENEDKRKPFYPSPVKQRSDFPAYIEDPYDKRTLSKKDEKEQKKPIFKPMSCGTKSFPTRSVLFGGSVNMSGTF